jgi:thioredoxin-like negative regulator of GroEL
VARQPGILLARGLALGGLDRPFEATALFRQVLDLKPDDEVARRAAAGLASALVASGFASEAEAVIARYPTCAEEAPGLERELAKREAVDAYEAGDYRRAETLIEAAKRRWSGEIALAEIEGWTLYHLNRYPEAERVFKELAANDGSADAAKGLQVVERKLYPF